MGLYLPSHAIPSDPVIYPRNRLMFSNWGLVVSKLHRKVTHRSPLALLLGKSAKVAVAPIEIPHHHQHNHHHHHRRRRSSVELQRQAQNALQEASVRLTSAPERRRNSSVSSIQSLFSDGDDDDDHDATSHMEQGQSSTAAAVFGTEITYQDYLTPREEIVRLSEGIAAFYVRQPQQDVMSSDNHMATANSIQGSLMINADGSLQPLSWRQRLIYRNSQEKLERKIERAKKEALVIVKEVSPPLSLSQVVYSFLSTIVPHSPS